MKIQIQAEQNNTFSIDVDNDQVTIAELKALIQSLNESQEEFRVIFSGKILEDEKTLADYGIADNATVYIVNKEKTSNPEYCQFDINEILNKISENPKSIYEIINQFPTVMPFIQQLVDHPEAFQQMLNMLKNFVGTFSAGMNQFQADMENLKKNPQIDEVFKNTFGCSFNDLQKNEEENDERKNFYKLTGLEETPELNEMLARNDDVHTLIETVKRLRASGINVFNGIELPEKKEISDAEKFAEQLKTMEDMGLLDTDYNIKVLKETYGNVNFAIEKIFNKSS